MATPEYNQSLLQSMYGKHMLDPTQYGGLTDDYFKASLMERMKAAGYGDKKYIYADYGQGDVTPYSYVSGGMAGTGAITGGESPYILAKSLKDLDRYQTEKWYTNSGKFEDPYGYYKPMAGGWVYTGEGPPPDVTTTFGRGQDPNMKEQGWDFVPLVDPATFNYGAVPEMFRNYDATVMPQLGDNEVIGLPSTTIEKKYYNPADIVAPRYGGHGNELKILPQLMGKYANDKFGYGSTGLQSIVDASAPYLPSIIAGLGTMGMASAFPLAYAGYAAAIPGVTNATMAGAQTGGDLLAIASSALGSFAGAGGLSGMTSGIAPAVSEAMGGGTLGSVAGRTVSGMASALPNAALTGAAAGIKGGLDAGLRAAGSSLAGAGISSGASALTPSIESGLSDYIGKDLATVAAPAVTAAGANPLVTLVRNAINEKELTRGMEDAAASGAFGGATKGLGTMIDRNGGASDNPNLPSLGRVVGGGVNMAGQVGIFGKDPVQQGITYGGSLLDPAMKNLTGLSSSWLTNPLNAALMETPQPQRSTRLRTLGNRTAPRASGETDPMSKIKQFIASKSSNKPTGGGTDIMAKLRTLIDSRKAGGV